MNIIRKHLFGVYVLFSCITAEMMLVLFLEHSYGTKLNSETVSYFKINTYSIDPKKIGEINKYKWLCRYLRETSLLWHKVIRSKTCKLWWWWNNKARTNIPEIHWEEFPSVTRCCHNHEFDHEEKLDYHFL